MNLINRVDLGNGRTKGLLPVKDGDGIAVWSVQGKDEGPVLVLTAGVHGCEYVGIVALRRLYEMLNPMELHGRVIILPLVNREGFHAGSRQVVPSDGKNLNRIFPPAENGTRADNIAQAIVQHIYPKADFLLELHGGEITEAMTPLVFYPATAAPAVAECARNAANHLKVDYRIPSTAQNGLYSYAAQLGVPALLMEVGGMGLWTEEQVSMELSSIQNLMGYLGMLPLTEKYPNQKETQKICYAEAGHTGFWIPAISLGDTVCKGETLGVIENLDGHIVEAVRAEWDGIILYYCLSLGVSRGDNLVTYGQV